MMARPMTSPGPPGRSTGRRRRERNSGDLVETIALAWSSLLANRMRSALTMLGVIIGIGAVISMVTIGRGAQLQTESQLKSLGSNLVFVQSGVAASTGPASRGAGSATTLIWEDAQAIAASIPAVADVAPNLSQRNQVVLDDRNTNTTVVGSTPAYVTVRDFLPLSGRFFNQAELNQAARVAVLGQTVVDSLGLTDRSALDRTIRIRGETFTVIGTLEFKGSTGFRDQDDQVLIPLTTMAARIVGVNTTAGVSVESIAVSARSAEAMEAAEYQITNLLRLRHRIVPPLEDDFLIRNQADLVNASNAVANVFTALLGGSAAISLLVGGIGIMNIMLVSVTERTREIGIRRAIGARCSDILRQFLIESTVLSLAGGMLGILLGVVASLAINSAFGWSAGIALDAVGWSLAFCLVIGVFFGAYPANKAAQLDPMTALRSD